MGAGEEVLPRAGVAAWLLPHAVKATSAISDTALSVSLRRINSSPSFEKEIGNGRPAGLPVAKRHRFAEPSGRQGGPKAARDSGTKIGECVGEWI